MHMLSNTQRRIAYAGAALVGVAAFLLLPLFAHAAPRAFAAVEQRGVCLRLGDLEGDFIEKIRSANTVYAKVAGERVEKIRAQASRRESEDAQAHKEADRRLAAHTTLLLERVQGDSEKKAAVSAFVARMKEISTLHRTRIAAAQKTFTDGVKALAESRDTQVEEYALSFTNDIKAALASAQSSCAGGTDPKSVRESLHTTLAALDAKYRASFADRSLFFEGLQTLTEARREAIRQANEAFVASVNEASQTLRSVL